MKNISFMPRRWRIAALVGCAAVLTGCANGPKDIKSDVQTFASMQGIKLPSTYRMELLPSQTQQQNFAPVEKAAENALQRVGLSRNARPDDAPLIVQLSASSSQGRANHPAYDSYTPHFGFGIGIGNGGWGGWGGGWGGISWMDTAPLVYYRAVQLVIRDVKTQQVVYETTAKYDEIRVNDAIIWDVLFDSALNGFPTPPTGPRQVVTTIAPTPESTVTPASVPDASNATTTAR